MSECFYWNRLIRRLCAAHAQWKRS